VPTASVVIPALNAAEVIGEQLDALSRQTYQGDWEVVVVDNGSTDGTAAAAMAHARRLPRLRVIDASQRRSHTFARNSGAAGAEGELLLYCDADDVVAPGWVAAFAAAAEEEGCDFMGGFVDDVSLNDPRHGAWRQSPPRDRLPEKMDFLPLAISANLAIRRSVLFDIGGWNKGYGEGCNDVELSWRAQVAGYRLCYVPEAEIAYRYRSSMRALARQMYRRGLAEPQLYGDFRPHGLPRRPVWRMAGGVAKLAVRSPDLVRGEGPRGRWVNHAATVVGRLRGSARHRSLYV
jgi:glycosyltransferase involved in cell wall biosynthesis